MWSDTGRDVFEEQRPSDGGVVGRRAQARVHLAVERDVVVQSLAEAALHAGERRDDVDRDRGRKPRTSSEGACPGIRQNTVHFTPRKYSGTVSTRCGNSPSEPQRTSPRDSRLSTSRRPRPSSPCLTRHPEARAQRASKDERPRTGRRPSRLAQKGRAPQGDGERRSPPTPVTPAGPSPEREESARRSVPPVA